MLNTVVDVCSVDLFKSKLNNFWMFQNVKYDQTYRLHNQIKQSIACRFFRCLSTMKSETNLVCNLCVIYLASKKLHSYDYFTR